MSDEQKVWFIYLTDHHEGPFTIAEVAAKVAEGLVTPQTLAWKDGMPEWLAVESIPELLGALAPAAPAAPLGLSPLGLSTSASQASEDAPALATDGEEEGVVSMAEMLAASVNQVNTGSIDTKAAAHKLMGDAPMASATHEPSETEDVWTLRQGKQVSGLYSLQQLKQMARSGEFSAQAQFWHPGWEDFHSLDSLPELAELSRQAPKKVGGVKSAFTASVNKTNTGISGTGSFGLKSKSQLIVGDDEPTNPKIQGLKKENFLSKLKAMFQKKPKAAVSMKAASPKNAAKKKTSLVSIVTVLVVILAGGGAAAYFLYFSSPIPGNLDVSPDSLQGMRDTVKTPVSQGALYIALATGTEDNFADDSNPKYYVATNLPEGTAVSFHLVGVPGTLIGASHSDRTLSKAVAANHIATFENIKKEDGKPLPIGEYNLTVSVEGAAKLEKKIFFGARKNAAYTKRLDQYKEKLLKDYDDELQFLKESMATLRATDAEVAKRITDAKAAKPNQKARLAADWQRFAQGTTPILTQLDQKIKEKLANASDRYYPDITKDLSTLTGQLQQLLPLEETQLNGGTATPNPEELHAVIQTGILSLDRNLTTIAQKPAADAILSIDAANTSAPVAPATNTAPAGAPVPTTAGTVPAGSTTTTTVTKPAAH